MSLLGYGETEVSVLAPFATRRLDNPLGRSAPYHKAFSSDSTIVLILAEISKSVIAWTPIVTGL